MAKSPRKRYNRAYLLGILLAVALLTMLLSPMSEHWLIRGPLIPGHEDLQCMDCHKKERGTLRQQLQANTQFLLGRRTQPVSTGFKPVSNQQCIACHERPNDRHPIYRFREPKYAEVRESIAAQHCSSCHLEHQNQRITVSQEFCQHCHDELKLNNDPLDTSHALLIQQQRWSSCLRCHDFHGNHQMKVAESLNQLIPAKRIEQYFAQGDNPYPGDIIHSAKTLEYEK